MMAYYIVQTLLWLSFAAASVILAFCVLWSCSILRPANPHVTFNLAALITMHLAWVTFSRVRRRIRTSWWRGRYGVDPPSGLSLASEQGTAIFYASLLFPFWVRLAHEIFPEELILKQANDMAPVGIVIMTTVAVLVVRAITRPQIRIAREIESLFSKGHVPCMVCGYDLTFTDSARCPECGTERRAP
jgi:hypothetical protein